MSNDPAGLQNQSSANQKAVGAGGLICILIAVIHVVMTRLCWSGIPLQTDTGMWSYIGGRILDGAMPYRDLWESKPPGIYFLFAAVEAIFGRSSFALIWLDAAVSLAVLYVAYRIACFFTSPTAAAVAIVILSFVFCHRILADWGDNVEKFVALFEMSACWILLSGRRADSHSVWVWLSAGGTMALASLFKQTGLAMLAAATFHTMWSGRVTGKTLAGSLKSVSLIWIGFAVVWLPVVIGMVVSGSWFAFVDQVVLYDVVRLAAPSGEGLHLFTAEHWRSVGESIRLGLVLFGPAMIMLLAVLRTGLLTRKNCSTSLSPHAKFQKVGLTLVAMYAAMAMIPALIAPHGYGHYLLQCAPPCAVIVASFITLVAGGKATVATRLVCLLSLVIGLFPMKEHVIFTLNGDTENGAYAAQRSRIEQLVEAVVQNTSEADRVMLWPPDYAVSYYANRVTPLECSNADVLFKGKSYRLSPPMGKLLARLRANPPDFVFDHTGLVLENSSEGPFVRLQPAVSLLEDPMEGHPLAEARLLASFKKWVRENYGGQTRVGPATIYRRGKPWREWEDYLLENGPNATPASAESP